MFYIQNRTGHSLFVFWTKTHDNKFSFSLFFFYINVISSQVLLIFVCILNMKINFHIYDNRKRFTTKYGSMIFNNNKKFSSLSYFPFKKLYSTYFPIFQFYFFNYFNNKKYFFYWKNYYIYMKNLKLFKYRRSNQENLFKIWKALTQKGNILRNVSVSDILYERRIVAKSFYFYKGLSLLFEFEVKYNFPHICLGKYIFYFFIWLISMVKYIWCFIWFCRKIFKLNLFIFYEWFRVFPNCFFFVKGRFFLLKWFFIYS